MRYTLHQARRALKDHAFRAGYTDIVAAINSAIVGLSCFESWDRLRKVVHMQVTGPYFTLPQDAASLTRACINGAPATVHGQDYRFLSSGPGDLTNVPYGYSDIAPGVVDLGIYPTMRPLLAPSTLTLASAAPYTPSVTVTGHTADGLIVTEVIPAGSTGEQVFADITAVTVAETEAPSYLKLLAEADGVSYAVSVFHPRVAAPEFHRYFIRDVDPEKTYDLLCEVKLNPLPLVEDTDVLPFPTLEPIRHYIMAERNFNTGEVDAGTKYQNLAIQAMVQLERAEDKKQTFTVINSLYDNSLGKMSDDYFNL